jgi:hypothetical protein
MLRLTGDAARHSQPSASSECPSFRIDDFGRIADRQVAYDAAAAAADHAGCEAGDQQVRRAHVGGEQRIEALDVERRRRAGPDG